MFIKYGFVLYKTLENLNAVTRNYANESENCYTCNGCKNTYKKNQN